MMITSSYLLLMAARHSGSLDARGFIILVLLAGCFILYFIGKCRGDSDGWRSGIAHAHNEMAAKENALTRKEDELKQKEQSANALIVHAENYSKEKSAQADALVDKARHTLAQARESARTAYADKEAELRGIVTTALSSHPDNAYIAAALTGIADRVLDNIIQELEWTAPKTGARIEAKFKSSARQWHLEAKYYKLQTLLYESLFPGLRDYATNLGEVEDISPAQSEERDWLSDEEYSRLSSTERSQLALDRYVASHNKSKWQIGRDYELYIGHCYRRKKYRVDYVGMERKLEDLGRDLVCRSDVWAPRVETLIVQCKYWSAEKLIREKHIMQLFGTAVEYALAHGYSLDGGHLPTNLKAVLITSTKLSDVAIRFANALGVEYHESIDFPADPASFPRIKCNKSSGIYHLPFDEQYDVTKIIPSEGDCFAFTVDEAERKGFRRAFRHFN